MIEEKGKYMCIYILWIMTNRSKEIYFTSSDGKLTVEALRLDLR